MLEAASRELMMEYTTSDGVEERRTIDAKNFRKLNRGTLIRIETDEGDFVFFEKMPRDNRNVHIFSLHSRKPRKASGYRGMARVHFPIAIDSIMRDHENKLVLRVTRITILP